MLLGDEVCYCLCILCTSSLLFFSPTGVWRRVTLCAPRLLPGEHRSPGREQQSCYALTFPMEVGMDLIYRVDRRGSALALPQKWRGFKSIRPFAFPPKPNHEPQTTAFFTPCGVLAAASWNSMFLGSWFPRHSPQHRCTTARWSRCRPRCLVNVAMDYRHQSLNVGLFCLNGHTQLNDDRF